MAFLTLRKLTTLGGVIAASAFVFACAAEPPKKKSAPLSLTDDNSATDPIPDDDEGFPIEPNKYNEDSGAFGAGERPADSGAPDTGNRSGQDAGPIKPPQDGGTPPARTYCNGGTGTVAAGDLAVVEIMISSKSGSGDSGEWIEIQNKHTDCWLKIKGITVESPRGAAAPNVATVADDFELAPNGTFVAADSDDPTKNHSIPGKVISFNATDVLKNDGDSVHVKLGAVQIDSVTYPAFTNLTSARALSFPNDCAWADRTAWERWSLTFTDYATGFKGTPNAENTDVVCF